MDGRAITRRYCGLRMIKYSRFLQCIVLQLRGMVFEKNADVDSNYQNRPMAIFETLLKCKNYRRTV